VSEDDLRAFRVGRDSLNSVSEQPAGPAFDAPQSPRLTEPTPSQTPPVGTTPPASVFPLPPPPASPGPIPGQAP